MERQVKLQYPQFAAKKKRPLRYRQTPNCTNCTFCISGIRISIYNIYKYLLTNFLVFIIFYIDIVICLCNICKVCNLAVSDSNKADFTLHDFAQIAV